MKVYYVRCIYIYLYTCIHTIFSMYTYVHDVCIDTHMDMHTHVMLSIYKYMIHDTHYTISTSYPNDRRLTPTAAIRNSVARGVNPFFCSCNTNLILGGVNPLKCMLQYVFCLGGVDPPTQL